MPVGSGVQCGTQRVSPQRFCKKGVYGVGTAWFVYALGWLQRALLRLGHGLRLPCGNTSARFRAFRLAHTTPHIGPDGCEQAELDPLRHRHLAEPALTARRAKDRLVDPGAGNRAHARPFVGRRVNPEKRTLRHQVHRRNAAASTRLVPASPWTPLPTSSLPSPAPLSTTPPSATPPAPPAAPSPPSRLGPGHRPKGTPNAVTPSVHPG